MPATEILLPVTDYNLAATLDSGQVFRWRKHGGSWIGVLGKHWVRLTQVPEGIRAEAAVPVKNWDWLRVFLQTEADLTAILKTFPGDAPLREAVSACRGLRVLRQDLWECLASFILSSTKQIVQIRQIISLLCERFGGPVVVPVGKKVRIITTANDVIHAWWVPALSIKKDAIPGVMNEAWFEIEADKPGIYRGQCAELCGRDHGFMPIVVDAKTPADYAAWVASMKPAPAPAAAATPPVAANLAQ